jgi:hypothetical protein
VRVFFAGQGEMRGVRILVAQNAGPGRAILCLPPNDRRLHDAGHASNNFVIFIFISLSRVCTTLVV